MPAWAQFQHDSSMGRSCAPSLMPAWPCPITPGRAKVLQKGSTLMAKVLCLDPRTAFAMLRHQQSLTSTACDSSCPDPALDPLLALPLLEAGASAAAAAAEPPAAASAGLEADLAAAASVPTRALAVAADGFKGIQKPCCVVKPVPVPCDLRTQPCMVQQHHPLLLLLLPGHVSVGVVCLQQLRGTAHGAAHRAGGAPAAAFVCSHNLWT